MTQTRTDEDNVLRLSRPETVIVRTGLFNRELALMMSQLAANEIAKRTVSRPGPCNGGHNSTNHANRPTIRETWRTLRYLPPCFDGIGMGSTPAGLKAVAPRSSELQSVPGRSQL